jgi:shikimate dehydrogenase
MKKFAVIGNPISHSLSPQIHQQFAAEFGIDICYERIKASEDDFKQVVLNFFANGGVGLNITVPFKHMAYDLCTKTSKISKKAGAVNVLFCKDNLIYGDNTDGAGLVYDVTKNLNFSIKDKDVLIIGAGGAVAGILYPILQQKPNVITLINRTYQKAITLRDRFNENDNIKVANFKDTNKATYNLIINATSTGLKNIVLPLDKKIIGKNCLCYDLSYKDSKFLQWAKENNAKKIANGKGMLIEQAALSFIIWHNKKPSTDGILVETFA